MIKTTKFYIVVLIAFVLAQSSGFAQYNGGGGDGSITDVFSQTSCPVPDHFYAYFGGANDGTHTDQLINTTCGIPPQFHAYMGGSDDGAGLDLLTLTSCATPPSQFFAYMGGNDDGSGVDVLNQVTCGIPSQFYAYMGGAANGFGVDSQIVCPTVPPVANFTASSTSVCDGTSVTFTDLSTNVPSAWSWSFPGGTPSTSIVQNPNIVYNTPGVYNVTLTATNSHGSNAVTMTGYITVNAIPTASAGTNVAICNGSFTTLNASGGTSYSWLPATGLSSTTIANPVATPASTTSYTVTATSNGCSATSSVSVTVNPIPTVSAVPITICNGSSGTLTASGASTYGWSPGLSAAIGTSVTANPTTTTTYTVTGTTGAGCSNSATVTVTVNPSPTANAGTDVTICNGTSTTLSASGGGSYSWSPSIGLSSATIANPVASPTVTRTYTVTVTNGTGCTSTDAVIVTVTPLPSASAGSNVSICNGSSTTLNGSGGTSYNWLPATALSSTTTANPIANPTTTTTYTVSVTNNGCTATNSVTVTVNPIPTASAGSNVSICNGSSTILTATGGGTYNWTPAFAGLNSTVIANPTATPSATTTYTVSVSNGTCSSTSAVTVTVNPLPTADAGSDVTICNGTSTSLSASGGTSYIWNPATGLSSNSIANPDASPTVTTSYTVSVINSNGCSATDVVIVNVNSVAPDAGNDVTICTGSSTTLNASGGTIYSWTPALGLSSTTVANPIANPTTTTSYTVSITNNGCTATDVVTVIVNSSLTADAGTDVSICAGSSTTLNASGGSTYSWSPVSGLSSTIIANPVATPAITTTYTVTASSGGCSSTSAVTVTVDPLPVVSITANGPTTFCQGDSVILTSSTGNSYLWSNGQTSSAITVLASGNHAVTVTSINGCSATSTPVNVIVHAITPSSISAGGATTFCQGDSVTLTASSGSSYLWSTGATAQSITVLTGNNYNVSVADVNGCSTSAASVLVTVNPNPPIPVISPAGIYNICVGDTVTLTADTANSYLWSNGATSSSIAVSSAGVFGVTVYNSFGCQTSSAATTEVTVNDPVSDFTATPLLVFIPSANVNFSAATNGSGPFTYLWDFGDASTSAASAPSHIYSNIGYKTILLTVSDSTGCSKTLSKSDYIQVEQLFPSTALTTGTTIDISGVSFVDDAVGIFTLTDGNCIVTLDTGNTWSPMPTGNTNALTGASLLPNNWFITGDSGTIMHSANNGASWTPFNTGTLEKFTGSSFSSISNGFAVGTNGTIQKYNGSSWNPEVSGTFSKLNAVEALSTGDAIAVGDNQTILKYNGSSWSPQTSPLPSFDIRGIKFSSALSGYAVGTGAAGGSIIKTTDGGNSWTPSLTGIDEDFNSVTVQGPDSAWATGTGGVVYTTVNNGATWIRYSVGHLGTQTGITKREGGKGHVTGHGGNGRVFEKNATSISVGVSSLEKIIGTFKVYPNPAHESITISMELPESNSLTISLKDMNGKELEQISDNGIAGFYKTELNLERYSSGIYFIHIRNGERSWVQKLIIQK